VSFLSKNLYGFLSFQDLSVSQRYEGSYFHVVPSKKYLILWAGGHFYAKIKQQPQG